MGYSLWGHKELDTTERLTLTEESGFSREAEPTAGRGTYVCMTHACVHTHMQQFVPPASSHGYGGQEVRQRAVREPGARTAGGEGQPKSDSLRSGSP